MQRQLRWQDGKNRLRAEDVTKIKLQRKSRKIGGRRIDREEENGDLYSRGDKYNIWC